MGFEYTCPACGAGLHLSESLWADPWPQLPASSMLPLCLASSQSRGCFVVGRGEGNGWILQGEHVGSAAHRKVGHCTEVSSAGGHCRGLRVIREKWGWGRWGKVGRCVKALHSV